MSGDASDMYVSMCKICFAILMGSVRVTFHAVRVPMKVSGFMKGIK